MNTPVLVPTCICPFITLQLLTVMLSDDVILSGYPVLLLYCSIATVQFSSTMSLQKLISRFWSLVPVALPLQNLPLIYPPAKFDVLCKERMSSAETIPVKQLSTVNDVAISLSCMLSNVWQFFNFTAYACAKEKYQSLVTYSISILPADVVVNSGRVATVALGMALVALVPVATCRIMMLGMRVLHPDGGA